MDLFEADVRGDAQSLLAVPTFHRQREAEFS
jgi:hypothetical protein